MLLRLSRHLMGTWLLLMDLKRLLILLFWQGRKLQEERNLLVAMRRIIIYLKIRQLLCNSRRRVWSLKAVPIKEVSGAEATVQVLKKPNRAFGALLGTSAAKRKFYPGRKEEEEVKLEQIKSSVNFPFHSFLGKVDKLQPVVKELAKPPEILHHEEPVAVLAKNSHLQDIILLDDDSDEEAVNDDPMSADEKSEQNEGCYLVLQLNGWW